MRKHSGYPLVIIRKPMNEGFRDQLLIDAHPMELSQPDEEDEDRPLVEDPLKPLTKSAKKKFSTTIGAKRKPVSELKMRQHMLTDYEEQEETRGGFTAEFAPLSFLSFRAIE